MKAEVKKFLEGKGYDCSNRKNNSYIETLTVAILLEQYTNGIRGKHRYCPYCGEPLSRNKHKIWCKDIKEQEEQT